MTQAIKVSDRTYEILEVLKEVRGSSFDRVVSDLVESFAPFLSSVVYDQDRPNVTYQGDKDKLIALNKKIGARSAYTAFWRRVEDELTAGREEDVTEEQIRIRMAEYDRLRSEGVI